jgi:inhibitor of cysteine peptidase
MKQILMLTLLGLGLAACGQANDARISAVDVPAVALTAAHNNTTVDLATDNILSITLDAQMSTGYNWHPVDLDETKLKLVGRTHTISQTLGGVDKVTLHFAGQDAGQAVVTLEYARAFDKEAAALAKMTYSVQVNVKGKYTGAYKGEPEYVAPTLSAVTDDILHYFFYCDETTCPAIKDQGQCGSCWAFATVGVVESLQKRQHCGYTSLSEQHLVSCNTWGYSCANGGLQGFPWYYDTRDQDNGIGTVYESDFPYAARDEACQPGLTHHDTLTSWVQMTPGVATTLDMKQALDNYGPLWVGVCADTAFQNYTGGLFAGSSCTSANHSVVLEGWDNDYQGGAWLLRNSWGTGWGENGYMWIAYGVNVIGTRASYAAIPGSPPAAPTGVTATATSSRSITVVWTAPCDADLYMIYRSTSIGGPFGIVGEPTTTRFVDAGLAAHTTYYYYVTAWNSYGESGHSATVSATTCGSGWCPVQTTL